MREASHHGGEDLETAPDAGSEHDSLVFNGRHGDLCTERDFSDSVMRKTRKAIHDEVPHQ